jgi:hypothetical protein
MERKVYFGNAEKQAWINAPRTGLQANSASFISKQQLISGRSHVRRSQASHRTFSPNWLGSLNEASIEDSLQTIKDFSDGIYGDGPFYWVDPFASNTNILPPHWAAPALTEKDWPGIAAFAPFEFVSTETNNLNYPATSVNFQYPDEAITPEKLRLIIPRGYSLYFGWHGSIDSGDATFAIDRHLRAGGIATVEAAPLAVTSSTRTNVTISGDTTSMVDIYLKKADAETCDLTVAGMIAQILPSNSFPEQGPFLSGRGTTGIEFSAPVQIEYYSALVNNGQIGMSTEWTEV